MAAKLTGGILIIIGIMGMAMALSAKEKFRLDNLVALKGDINILMSELLYNKATFYQGIKLLKGELEVVYREILKGLDNNNSPEASWNYAFSSLREKIYFENDDIEELKLLGSVFSSPDYSYQRSEITAAINRLDEKIKLSREKYIKNSRLYRSISASAGAFAVVLLF